LAIFHQLNVFNEASPILKQIADHFDEMVNLGVFDQGEVVYLDKVESNLIVKAIFILEEGCLFIVLLLEKCSWLFNQSRFLPR